MKTRAALLAWLVLLLTASAVALSSWQNLQSREAMRQELLAQTERRSVQLADAMAGQVESLLGTLDLALLQLRESWDGDPARFDPVAQRVLAVLPQGAVSHVSVSDERDLIVYDSLGTGRAIYVGDLRRRPRAHPRAGRPQRPAAAGAGGDRRQP